MTEYTIEQCREQLFSWVEELISASSDFLDEANPIDAGRIELADQMIKTWHKRLDAAEPTYHPAGYGPGGPYPAEESWGDEEADNEPPF